MAIYTYKESLMKRVFDTCKELYNESDKYTLVLRLPLLAAMLIVGIPLVIILDTLMSWGKL